MFANKDIILRKMALKGVRVYDIYLDSGCNRKVYTAFEKNIFTKDILKLIEKRIGEDLSMYNNSKILQK